MIILGLIFQINTKALSKEHPLIFNDLSTTNFEEKLSEINLSDIKKICSYDFCDYFSGENIKTSIQKFLKNYLDTINDEEVKNTIKVKGLKITKVILEN